MYTFDIFIKGRVGLNRIRELRVAKGWQQKELADRLNIGANSISRYETGKRELDPATINAICDLFGCTADYLLGRSSSPAAAVSDEDAALLAAYHEADQNIQNAIDALLQPWLEIKSEDAQSQA